MKYTLFKKMFYIRKNKETKLMLYLNSADNGFV